MIVTFMSKNWPSNLIITPPMMANRTKFRYRRDTVTVRADEPFIYDLRFAEAFGDNF